MPQIDYKINLIEPETLQKFESRDTTVIESFSINSAFKAFENKVELHIFSMDNDLLQSYPNYNDQAYLAGSQGNNDGSVVEMTLDPMGDMQKKGFTGGDIKLVYNFLDDIYSDNKLPVTFFIEEISKDRTELRLLTTQATDEYLDKQTEELKKELESKSYLDDFRLNFGSNNLVIGVNIDSQPYRDFTSIVVKLYKPLPPEFGIKSTLTLDRLVADSTAYEIEGTTIPDTISVPHIKPPNFNIEEEKEIVSSTEYFNYNELFNFPISESFRQLNSLFSEKGIDISIDYANFDEFIHFGSITDRLENFRFKVNQISSSQALHDNAVSVTGTKTSHLNFYSSSIKNIIDNFDHYERFLYYESSSHSWPKQVGPNGIIEKPYIIATGSATGSWYDEKILSASNFDVSNQTRLINAVPAYIQDDTDNAPFVTFGNMIGQHFDNVWIYSKALSDKYDADNRINKGIPAQLVEEALRNFGVKLYASNRSIEDLISVYQGELYNTGSELINSFTTGSLTGSQALVSEDQYRTQLYKRLYHNLPYLLKSKGTERGVKALITSFGIPTNNNYTGANGSHNGLLVRTVGGGMVDSASNAAGNTPNLGQFTEFTSSLGRVRIDNTGSIEGSTLSQYISIVKRDNKYADDLHSLEVGFSPTHVLDERINNYFIASASGQFNIDDILGDPGYIYSSSYSDLFTSASDIVGDILTGSGTTHRQNGTYVISGSNFYGDMIRTLKFYDNVVFKSVKDYIPARSSISEGMIIKPHVLERNKIKQVQVSGSQLPNSSSQVITDQFVGDITLTGSISINENTGSSGGAFGGQNLPELTIPLTASYIEQVMTSGGLATYTYHDHEEARFDGELSGSVISSSYFPNELNRANIFKYEGGSDLQYKFKRVNTGADPSPSVSATPSVTPSVSTTPSVTPTPTRTATPSPTPACTRDNCAFGYIYASGCNSSPSPGYIAPLSQNCPGAGSISPISNETCWNNNGFGAPNQAEVVGWNECTDSVTSNCSSAKFVILGNGPGGNKNNLFGWDGVTPAWIFARDAVVTSNCTSTRVYQSC